MATTRSVPAPKNRRRRGVRAAVTVLVAGLMQAAGCVSIYVPDPSREGGAGALRVTEPSWPGVEAWPARSPMWSGLRRATIQAGVGGGGGMRPRGTVIVSPGAFVAINGGEGQAERAARELRDDASTLMMRRDWRSEGSGASWGGASVTTEGRGAYVFVGAGEAEARTVAQSAAGSPAFTVRFLSGRDRGADAASRGAPRVAMQLERTWMAFYDPLPGRGEQAAAASIAVRTVATRGTVVVIPGMFGTPEGVTDELVGKLREQGWSVLRLLAHPSRFTERLVVAVNVADAVQLARVAGEVATELADRASECAYAVHAGLLAAGERRPGLAERPRVLIGMSGGAMVVPAVMAYRPGDFAGAVLIGGGVGYLRIALESSYTGWIDALSFTGPGGAALSREEKREFLAAYDRVATLDSKRLAPVLRGRPTLMLHASGDTAVPAAAGDELWELAGRCERWTFGTGHELLFFMLPSAMPRMMRWLDEHFPAGAAPGGPAGAAPGGPAGGTPGGPAAVPVGSGPAASTGGAAC